MGQADGGLGRRPDHIIKASFLSLLWCAVKTTQAWHKQARGVHKRSTHSSEKEERRVVQKVLQMGLLGAVRSRDGSSEDGVVGSGRGLQAAGEVEDHAAPGRRAGRLGPFSAPFCAPEEGEAGRDGEKLDDDEGDLDDDAGVQKLTAKQKQRLESMAKYPVEKRAHGNWLAKRISGMEGLASKRQAVAERQTRHRAQLGEAARLHDSRTNEAQAKRARHHVEGPKREDLYKTAVALTAA